MAGIYVGPYSRKMTRDQNGHREYTLVTRVRSDNFTGVNQDGPFTISHTPGLPFPGAIWQIDGDRDKWAWCTWFMEVTAHKQKEGEPTEYYLVKQKFTTRTPQRCQDTQFEDPLMEPPKVSGSFVKFMREATIDKDDKPIRTSSHELFRGPQIEFPYSNPTVHIEMNVGSLDLHIVSGMMNRVNGTPMWGLNTRMVLLANASWERHLFGRCNFYYTWSLDFDVDFGTFDRYLLDEGDKVLNGKWVDGVWTLVNIGGSAPDPDNPRHFIRAIDFDGNPIHVMLDGSGEPIGTGFDDDPATRFVQKFKEDDLFLLGIPASF